MCRDLPIPAVQDQITQESSMMARPMRIATPLDIAAPECDNESQARGRMECADLTRRTIRLGPAVVGAVLAVLLTGCGGVSTDDGGRDSTPSATSPPPTLVRATSNTGCEVTDTALAAHVGEPQQKLVDDAQRVCEGEWAYWPAKATTVDKSLLIYKSAETGRIFIIGYGDTSCSRNPAPDAPPVPSRIQQARGCA
jgi:hypothetical protein